MREVSTYPIVVGALLVALVFAVPATAQPPGGAPGFNRAEVNGCWSCHYAAGTDHMQFVSETWLQSTHANTFKTQATDEIPADQSNTYCARCHAPVQGDPSASRTDPSTWEAVPLSESMAITCSSCHLDHTTAGFLGTRTGSLEVGSLWWDPAANDGEGGLVGVPNQVVDPDTGEVLHEYEGVWDPLIHHGDNSDVLCEKCHNGHGHHPKKEVMYAMRHVQCIDCHMPKMPVAQLAKDPVTVRMTRDHSFGFPHDEEALAMKAAYSCGTEGLGCHAGATTEWAVEFIDSGMIHEPGVSLDEILDFAVESYVAGRLYGVPGPYANYYVYFTWIYLLEAQSLLDANDMEGAFWKLIYVYAACDGEPYFLQDVLAGEDKEAFNELLREALLALLPFVDV